MQWPTHDHTVMKTLICLDKKLYNSHMSAPTIKSCCIGQWYGKAELNYLVPNAVQLFSHSFSVRKFFLRFMFRRFFLNGLREQ